MVTPHNGKVNTVGFFALVFDMDIYEQRNYKDFMWAVELNRFGLELIGIWPKIDDTTNDIASDFRLCTFLVLMIFAIIIPLLCSLVRVWDNVIFMTNIIQIILPLVTIIMRLVIIRWKKTGFSSMIKMMVEDWMEVKLNSEKNVMIKRARAARLIALCANVMIALGSVSMIVPALLGVPAMLQISNITNSNRILPLHVRYFYDTEKSPQFELTVIVQLITLCWGTAIYLSVDALLGLLILHLCGQLENLKCRIANLICWKDFDSALHNNVDYHTRLIRFAKNIEDMFSLMILVLLLYFCIEFCLFGTLLVTEIINGITNAFVAQLSFLIMVTTDLLILTFLYCASGEIIEKQSEAVYRAICDLEWYKLECKNGRSIIFLMIRSNKSLQIKAGKMVPLTMSTFCNLLKTSVGYVSIFLAKRI